MYWEAWLLDDTSPELNIVQLILKCILKTLYTEHFKKQKKTKGWFYSNWDVTFLNGKTTTCQFSASIQEMDNMYTSALLLFRCEASLVAKRAVCAYCKMAEIQ